MILYQNKFYSHIFHRAIPNKSLLHMLKSETELRLGSLLHSIARAQQRLEMVREVLVELPSFDPYCAFCFLGGPKKGYISAYDLKELLDANGISVDSEELFQLVSRYNPTSTGFTYQDFIKFALPSDKGLQKITLIRTKTPLLRKSEEIPYEVKYGLCRLINTELAMNKKTEMLRKALVGDPNFSMLEAFRSVDKERVGHIAARDLAKFLQKVGYLLEGGEPSFILQRLDKDGDGLLSYVEFVEGILPFEERKGKVVTPLKPAREETKTRSETPVSRKVQFASPLKKFDTPEKTIRSPSTQASTAKKPIKSILKSPTTPIFSSEKQTTINEETLAEFLQEQIWLERRLEKAKVDLALQPDFTFHGAFRLFDKAGKGYTTFEEFLQYAKENSIKGQEAQIENIFNKYTRNEKGRLRLSRFIEMVSPSQTEYAKLLLNRMVNVELSIKSKVKFNLLLELAFKVEDEGETLKRKAKFDPYKAFEILDFNEIGYISSFTVKEFLKKNGVRVGEADIIGIMNRYDHNKDGKVSLSEFVEEIAPNYLIS